MTYPKNFSGEAGSHVRSLFCWGHGRNTPLKFFSRRFGGLEQDKSYLISSKMLQIAPKHREPGSSHLYQGPTP